MSQLSNLRLLLSRAQFSSCFIQSAFTVGPFSLGAFLLAAIEFAKTIFVRNLPDNLRLEPKPDLLSNS